MMNGPRRVVLITGASSGIGRATSILKERIMAGIARARDKGTKSGKPIGRPCVPATIEAAIAKALQQGKYGIHKIAARHSVGVGVVQRIKASL
jgi:short-subunit dehydrogenase